MHTSVSVAPSQSVNSLTIIVIIVVCSVLLHITGFVQYLQFRYQKGVLYRLKALGERHNMDITIEGFHSWMWRGLSFLLPFLFAGYVYQAYNSWTLYQLSFHKDAPWQVCDLSMSRMVVVLIMYQWFSGACIEHSVFRPVRRQHNDGKSYGNDNNS